MLPIAAFLLEKGLSLAANAVLAKGKEWVEEKTGIDLSDPEPKLTPEQLTQIKQWELENETELAKLRVEDNRLELEGFKTEVADRQSARGRDEVFIKSGKHNYRADVMFVLAAVLVGVLIWIVWKDDSINEYAKGIFTLVLGRFLGYLDNIYNFEFGTTRGSRSKDATIDNLSKGEK